MWLIICHYLSPTTADNIVKWDLVVLIATLIDGFELAFALLQLVVMHDGAFKVTTTYPFPRMIFSLCKSTGVPIWPVDKLKTPLGTVNIGLIRDETNELASHRGPRPEFPPPGDNRADTVA